jgi:hypothetical protein
MTDQPTASPKSARWWTSRRASRLGLVLVAVLAVGLLLWPLMAYLTGDARAQAIRDETSSCGLGARYDWSTLRGDGTRPGALGGTEYLYVVALADTTGGPTQFRHFLTDDDDPPAVGTEDMDPVWLHACAESHPDPFPSASVGSGAPASE